MVILAIGDVVGDPGMDILCRRLGRLQRQVGADLTVVNGENATGRGITPALAEDIFYAGADVITLGNHTFANRQICDYLDEQPHILRPLNFPAQQPGQGSVVAEVQGRRVCVANLQGRVGMDYNVSSPFSAADALLRETEADLFLLDFHAEATSEKLAMGYHLAGRAAAVWGTHTHVPTADERVYPKGTGYLTDLGMTGPIESVLGVEPKQSVEGFLGGLPGRYRPAEGPCKLQGAVFTLDSDTGLCTAVERVEVR